MQQSINADIDNKVHTAGFCALGIVNKLITGPLFRLVEEEGHIFALNTVWYELQVLLERCSQNKSTLLYRNCSLPGGILRKDSVYEELFCDTGDEEFDVLTVECSEICCSCLVLVNRQLKGQLPGGKFYQLAPDVIEETSQKTNILSERGFAQMDRKVSQKPNISTIAASGAIFIS